MSKTVNNMTLKCYSIMSKVFLSWKVEEKMEEV